MKVLFLTPWYPSEKDAMSGLFVQKHVEAVRAQGVDVRVIFSQGWCDLWHQWKALRREGWMPDVVQLNVIQKQGLLALWLKKKYGIPYVIVEHWSGYLPENGMFMAMSWLQRKVYQYVARKAEMILTVSDRQAEAMRACGIENERWGRIDNVVDEEFFNRPPTLSRREGVKTFLHVSCFDERAKNVKGLLRAAKMLSEKRKDWKLVLVGTGVDYEEVREYAGSLEIPDGLLEWTGELTPREVAERMHEADAFVLSSRYETYGVVLAEALAAGLPILSTPVGIAPEVADILVPQEIAQNKAGKFAEFLEAICFEPLEVRHHKAGRFASETIGKRLIEVYDSCMHRDI